MQCMRSAAVKKTAKKSCIFPPGVVKFHCVERSGGEWYKMPQINRQNTLPDRRQYGCYFSGVITTP